MNIIEQIKTLVPSHRTLLVEFDIVNEDGDDVSHCFTLKSDDLKTLAESHERLLAIVKEATSNDPQGQETAIEQAEKL